jgi:hypothetical protein
MFKNVSVINLRLFRQTYEQEMSFAALMRAVDRPYVLETKKKTFLFSSRKNAENVTQLHIGCSAN